ncbi:hypothetical protein ABPG75_001539 [Micractinium tetrahymenae]
MPPSAPAVIAEWCRTPLDQLLAAAEASGGGCLPHSALAAAHELHKLAAVKVPAYAAFLEDQQRHSQQQQQQQAEAQGKEAGSLAAPAAASRAAPAESWQAVPFTTKQNYFHAYPLPARCMGGRSSDARSSSRASDGGVSASTAAAGGGPAAGLGAADFVHTSSGSSGAPTLWARNVFDELAVCTRFEQVLWDNFGAHRHPTLAVVALPLGSWVGGLFTTLCLRYLTLKGYRLTTVTPGNSVPHILQLVGDLAPHFHQTVLLGYPPFLKGVADAGVAAGLPWADYRVRLVLAGEVFSEEWRSLMAQRLGMRDVLRDVVSLYGTADAGVIGNETALSVAIRRWLAKHPEAAAELFGKQRLPTLVQYDPHSRLLEAHPEDGTLVVTAVGTPNMAAPLLRYCIGDAGGFLSYADMLRIVEERGFVLPAGVVPVRKLPFAWVFGRSFWTVSVFGANVYVENIMSGMEQPELAEATTGKFVLCVEESADLDSQLAVRVELAPGVQPSAALQAQVAAVLLRELRRLNSEYAAYVPTERQLPAVHLHTHADPAWFPAGVKHKWVLDGGSGSGSSGQDGAR